MIDRRQETAEAEWLAYLAAEFGMDDAVAGKSRSPIGLVNAWNRLRIGFRTAHPAEVKRAAV